MCTCVGPRVLIVMWVINSSQKKHASRIRAECYTDHQVLCVCLWCVYASDIHCPVYIYIYIYYYNDSFSTCYLDMEDTIDYAYSHNRSYQCIDIYGLLHMKWVDVYMCWSTCADCNVSYE